MTDQVENQVSTSSTNETFSAIQTESSNLPADVATNLEYVMNLTKEWQSQNITLELAGERVFFVECTVSDGQVFLMFQSDKGSQYLIPPESLTVVNNNDSESNIDDNTQMIVNDIISSVDANLITNVSAEASVKTSGVFENADKISEITQDKLDSAKIEVSEKINKIDVVKNIETAPQEVSKVLIDDLPSVNDKVNEASEANVIVPKVSSGSIIISNSNKTNDLNSNSSQNNVKPSGNDDVSLAKRQDSNSSLLDSFSTKSKNLNITNSPKTYSRNSNIVWITPDKSSNENGVCEKVNLPKCSLTTTIEIAEPIENKRIDTFGMKVNKINVNNISKSICTFEKKQLPDLLQCNSTILKKDVSPLKTSSNNSVNIKVEEPKKDVTIEKPDEATNISESSVPKEKKTTTENNVKLDDTAVESNESLSNFNNPVKDSSISSTKTNNLKRAADISEPARSLRSSSTNSSDSNSKKSLSNNANNTTQVSKSKKKVAFDLQVAEEKDTESVFEGNYCKKFKNASHYEDDEIETLFKINEIRDDVNFNDYKRDCLSVSVRIQPDDRHDYNQDSFSCDNCGFVTAFLNTYIFHQNSCVVYKYNINSFPTEKSLSPKLSNSFKKFKPSVDSNDADSNDSFNEQYTNVTIDSNHSSSDNDKSESQSSDDSATLGGYTEKDVVWIETKMGYWPALIMTIVPVEKKLSLRLIDCPLKKKSLKTSLKHVVSFNDATVNKKMLKECKVHGDLLLKAVQKVEDYLRKRCLGTNVNAVKFFNFVEFFEMDGNTTEEVVDSKTQGEEEQNQSSTTKSNISFQTESSKLLKFIKDSKVETHLIGIYKGTIESDRHNKFLIEENKEIKSDLEKTGFGPIKDEDQQDELFRYCSRLFKKHFESEKIDIVSYIYSVWVPEAIVKAISRVYQVDNNDAESIFNQAGNIN